MKRFGTAEEFGLKGFRNVNLSLGSCVIPAGRHKGTVASSQYFYVGIAAHTHMCQRDPYFRYICLPSWGVKDAKGEPSVLFWHEYGHWLDRPHEDCSGHSKEFPLGTSQLALDKWQEEHTNKMHGDSFKEIMTKLGFPELATPVIDFTKPEFRNITFGDVV